VGVNIFGQLYKNMDELYKEKKYEQVFELGKTIFREVPIPKNKEFHFYALMSNACLLTGKWAEGETYAQKSLKAPEDDNIREMKRQMYSNLLCYMHFFPGINDSKMFTMAKNYSLLFTDREKFSHRRRVKKHKKIKIGYLSTDFFEHIVTHFTIQLYSAYNRDRFEVHLYNIGTKHNEVTDWISEMADGWHDLHGRPSREIAQSIYDDEIDILFDLSGHTMAGRTLLVSSHKPAPIQIAGIGYWNTTGLPAIDYFLSDKYCSPPENDDLFTEKLIRLPHSHFCYTPPESVKICDFTYKMHHPVVFGSFNNYNKISDDMLVLWLKIIRQVPGSRLLLKNVQPGEEKRVRMRQRLFAIGFKEDEVILRGPSWPHLHEYADMDIALDTYPYVGGGTTCEALYMGVPVISRYGVRHGSRFGYSFLHNIGLGELSAATDEEYVSKAVELAKSPELLQLLHEQLRTMMQASPVMDGSNYLREIETAYEKIYSEWQEKNLK